MKFYSTNGKSRLVDFQAALMRGLAEDGGLFLPTELAKYQISNVKCQNLQSIATNILEPFVGIPRPILLKICAEAFNFPAPLVKLSEDLYILELFHGPTLSFKDFGARFMARAMDYYISDKRQATSEQGRATSDKVNIIVATSGDTGSAVAQGFYGMENIRVLVLYPQGRVSKLQEQQMATLGGNIVALEVEGDFDDCQRLAKMALADKTLGIPVSSANSINIGRLLPQMVYYFWAARQFLDTSKCGAHSGLCDGESHHSNVLKNIRMMKAVSFVVPSGNFGNLTAGLLAKKLGLPCGKFVAAVNKNSIVPQFLANGEFLPRKTEMTYSSAMDVGIPSNWLRVIDLYKGLRNTKSASRRIRIYEKIKEDMEAITVSEAETKKTIAEVYKKFGYVADPHTAVGIAAAENVKCQMSPPKADPLLVENVKCSGNPCIVLATAHPAKFPEIVESAIGRKVELPKALRSAVYKKKRCMFIGTEYRDFVEVLKSLN